MDINQLTGAQAADVRRILRLLQLDPRATPVDLALADGITNARYARELIGLARTLALVTDDESTGTDWDTGRLALTPQGVLYLSQNATTTGHSPKEHTMASTKTQTAAKTDKTVTAHDETVRYCGCGCKTQVAGKSIFKQGHDARMVSHLVGSVVGSSKDGQTPPAFTVDQVATATGSEDIQYRINETAKAVESHFGAPLAAKFHQAAMNGWTNYDKKDQAAAAKVAKKAEREAATAARKAANADKKAAAEAAKAAKAVEKAAKAQAAIKIVKAKVGRFEREGTVTDDGAFLYTDAKGNEQVAPEGKYTLITA